MTKPSTADYIRYFNDALKLCKTHNDITDGVKATYQKLSTSGVVEERMILLLDAVPDLGQHHLGFMEFFYILANEATGSGLVTRPCAESKTA
jgi:hypothetical protein